MTDPATTITAEQRQAWDDFKARSLAYSLAKTLSELHPTGPCGALARCVLEQGEPTRPTSTIPRAIVDQPSPIATTRRAAWDIVIEHTESRRHYASTYSKTVFDLVLADMRERDQTGRERYGIPLTAGNGRNHLVDAYQELLDGTAYFAAYLDEHGVGPETCIEMAGDMVQWRLHTVQETLRNSVRTILQLRAIIEEETKTARMEEV